MDITTRSLSRRSAAALGGLALALAVGLTGPAALAEASTDGTGKAAMYAPKNCSKIKNKKKKQRCKRSQQGQGQGQG